MPVGVRSERAGARHVAPIVRERQRHSRGLACLRAGRPSERAERLLAEAVAGRRPFVVLAPYEALLQPLRQGPAMRALAVRLQQLQQALTTLTA